MLVLGCCKETGQVQEHGRTEEAQGRVDQSEALKELKLVVLSVY